MVLPLYCHVGTASGKVCMQETSRPSESLFSEEAEGWQAKSLFLFFPFPLCCPAKTFLCKFCCVKRLKAGSLSLSSYSNLTPYLCGLEEPFKADLHLFFCLEVIWMIQNIQNLKREGSVGWGRLTFSLQRESWALSSKSNPAFPAADAPGAKCIQQENEVGE